MTAKDAIQIIREKVRAVQATGTSSISAEALQQLLNHLDSSQAEKDIAALVDAQKEMALATHRSDLAEYGTKANAQLELFKSVIQSGESARKSFFLLNGGAAVAVLALIAPAISAPSRARERRALRRRR